MVAFGADRKMQTMTQDDIPALVMAALKNPSAFGRLYDRYVQPIHRYIYSRVDSAHEAEDITSQTFMAAYESLARYRERGQFSAWLFRIARSKMHDHFRKSRREVGLEAVGQILEREDALLLMLEQLDDDGNVIATGKSDINLENQFSVRFDNPGVYHLYCSENRDTYATIIVK